jgi:hypothetical protein
MNNWRVELKGVKEQRARADKIMKNLHGTPMMTAMRDAALLVTRSARKEAPHDRGILRNSIVPEVRSNAKSIFGVVGSNVAYAPHQELGTRPFWPASAPLEAWARRKGIDVFLVACAIAAHGIKPKKFLLKGFQQNFFKIGELIDRAVHQLVKN